MEILHHNNYKEMLHYLSGIKLSQKEWLFVDVRLSDICDENFTISSAANLICDLYNNQEGKLYIYSDHEMVMIMHWGKNYNLSEIIESIEHQQEGSYEIRVQEPTAEGLIRLHTLFTRGEALATHTMADMRKAREENIILLADDDMYTRMLVKEGCPADAKVYEVSDGAEVLAAYLKYIPDILLLDVHMPNINGTDILRNILALDPEAYIVMLSADCSKETIDLTASRGAKGFLTKPFKKDKLVEYIKKCPTMHSEWVLMEPRVRHI
ncbi:MAG: response regulator [Alphaproteobacteria bacterium]